MNKDYQKIAIVIPSLEPTQGLVAYTKELIAQGFMHIYIVNDGSDGTYDPIFQRVSALEECTLLTHPHNRGKGAALKTAFHHISQTYPQCRGVITADSDGQHAVKDVCRMADSLLHSHGGLLLGGRNFSNKSVPFQSLIGNRISALIFWLLHGALVQDTQTGLRGFDIALLPEMCAIQGERFEYEMAVLTTCTSKKIPIHFIPIDTIYIDGNVGSHFRPLADSARIGWVLLGGLCRFLMSSGISAILDIALCWSFLSLLAHIIPSDLLRIGLCVVLARTISMVVNYTINKVYVFRRTTTPRCCFGRYLLLVIANMAALTVLIYCGHHYLGISERLITILSNVLLFIVNYQIQKIWVFSVAALGGTA